MNRPKFRYIVFCFLFIITIFCGCKKGQSRIEKIAESALTDYIKVRVKDVEEHNPSSIQIEYKTHNDSAIIISQQYEIPINLNGRSINKLGYGVVITDNGDILAIPMGLDSPMDFNKSAQRAWENMKDNEKINSMGELKFKDFFITAGLLQKMTDGDPINLTKYAKDIE